MIKKKPKKEVKSVKEVVEEVKVYEKVCSISKLEIEKGIELCGWR